MHESKENFAMNVSITSPHANFHLLAELATRAWPIWKNFIFGHICFSMVLCAAATPSQAI